MRDAICRSLVGLAADPAVVFLTGDLGFKALEPLREALGGRFLNAGIAEQNMIAVAAGLARGGMRPWTYSIASFLYARPFEQIRNDVCQHRLPVRLIGNGGGYAYGVMGGTHHALEDYGALCTLPHLQAFVPAFDDDVGAIVAHLGETQTPAYLRLGLSEAPAGWPVPAWAPWRRLVAGDGPTVVAVGPLAGALVGATLGSSSRRPDLWCLSVMPIDELPRDFCDSVARSGALVVVEEHVAQGGAGAMLARALLLAGFAPRRFVHHHALGYPSGRYGSQAFHRRESALAPEAVLRTLAALESS